MRLFISGLLLMLLLSLMPAVRAQDAVGVAPLPRVLLIGDSVVSHHARGVGQDLAERAQVVIAQMPAGEVVNSQTVLANLDVLLGFVGPDGRRLEEADRPRWDLIHFNVGLGDLIHRVPNIKSMRVLPIDAGGVVTTGPQAYAENLEKLAGLLKTTGAKVIWSSTTPIRSSTSNVFELGSEVRYNALAAEVMARHGIAVNDMYSYVSALINMDKPAPHGADPFDFDRKPIHMPIVRVIEKAFDLEAMPQTQEEIAADEGEQTTPAQG